MGRFYTLFSKVIRSYDEEEDEAIAGTQLLDRSWQDLKKHVPKNLAAEVKKHGLLSSEIWEWPYSFQWRFSAGSGLWKECPKVLDSANRQNA